MRLGSIVLVLGLALVACSGSSATQPPPAVPAAPPAPAPAPTAAPTMTLAQAGIVPEWMDRKADPCQDFFEYACGGFLKSAAIPPDRNGWGTIQIVAQRNEKLLREILEKAARAPGTDPVQQKIGDYYAACMDEDAIEKAGVKPLAAPLAIIAKVTGAASAARAVIELHAMGVFPFFDIGPTQDYGDATQVIAQIDQAGLGLPDRDYYLEDKGNMKDVRAAYRAHVGRMFALLGVRPREAKAAVADVMRIETGLARIQQDQVARRDPHNIYHRIDRAGLEKVAPGFPWGAYLKRLGMDRVSAITVNDPKYYAGVVRMLRREKPAALRHYLTFTLLAAAAPDLSKAFVDEDFKLRQVLQGQKELEPRWRRCVGNVDRDLGQLLAQPYVAARFGGRSRATAIDLTRAILDGMRAELTALPWMDAGTRAAAVAKLDTMAYLVGFPDHWRAYPFAVVRTSHFANVLAAQRFELGRQLAKIGKPVDRGDWEMTPPTVNAYYEPTLNVLALPAGQLQPPFFNQTFHPAVNFAATGGGTIGHEATHGFDDEGSQFDADGNLRNWWSKPTAAEFARAAQCVVDQYAQYEAVPGVKLDGKLTAGENIADIGGVKIGHAAYQAWKAKQTPPPPAEVEGLSDEQIYFLAYAQSWCMKLRPERLETMAHSNPHSPPRWRVNGVVVDEPAFAPAFQCAAGTPMNPGKSCSVW